MMPRIVFAPARRAFPRESRVRVASSFATSSSSSARTSGNAGGGAANDAAKVAKGSESSSFLRLLPGEPPEPIPARPGLFASSAVVHGFENGFVNPENQSDADDEGEDFGENFSHLSDFSDFSPPPRVGDASTRTASMSSEVDEELGDDAFVARIGSVDFESDACRGDFSPASVFVRSAFVSVFASASNARSAASTNAARNSSAASSPASRYAVSAEAISLAAAFASRDPNVGARDSRANAEPIADPSFTPEGSSSSSSAPASATDSSVGMGANRSLGRDGDGDGDEAARREDGDAVDFDFAPGPRRVSPNPASARAAARRSAETSRAHTAAGVPRSYPRARRVGGHGGELARGEARGGEDDPEDDEEEHPREGEGEGEGEEGERGTSSAPAPARASDGAPRRRRTSRRRATTSSPCHIPRGRLGGGRRTSGPRRGSASPPRGETRESPRPPPRSRNREGTWASPSPPFASAPRGRARPPVDRGRWFHFPPALEECFPRLRRGA